LSDGPVIVLTLLVLGTFPAWLVQVMRLIGGLFILYLAAGALRSWQRNNAPQPDEGPGRSVMSAALVNLFNPNVYLYWAVVMGPLLITGWREQPGNGIGLLAGFYGTMLATLAGLIGIFGLAGLRGERLNRMLVGLSGLALAGFGLYQIALGIQAIFLM
jgi:threonine/homoserine/homoserine lactone efflux protein